MGQLFPQRDAIQLVVDGGFAGDLDDGIGGQILLAQNGEKSGLGAPCLYVGTLKGAVERVMDHQGALHGTADGGNHRHTVQTAQLLPLLNGGIGGQLCQRKHRIVDGDGQTDAIGGQFLDAAL